MPHKDSNIIAPEGTSVQKPAEPGLGIMREAGTVGVLPRGAMLVFIDPKLPGDGIVPMAIVEVDRHHMKLRCPCGQPNCNRVANVKINWQGRHPQRER